MEIRDYRKIVDKYVNDVISGEKTCGKLQIYAVKRFQHDIDNSKEKGIYLDEKVASYACNSFHMWKHTIGSQFVGNPMYLEPWQAFCIWNLFGWKRTEDKLRRFNRGFISVAAKSGKTTFMAGMALLLAMGDIPIEASANVYTVATSLKQARICYDQAVEFIQGNEYTNNESLLDIYYGNSPCIKWSPNNAVIQPFVLAGSVDGVNAHAIIRDELHAFTEKHREPSGKLPSRMATRQQPFMIDITTAGSDSSVLWEEEYKIAVSVVESVITGVKTSESYFSFICSLDEGDDVFDEKNWYKANPSLGVTVSLRKYRELAEEARHLPTKLSDFTRYQCNTKSSASARAIMPEQWAQGNRPVRHAEWDAGFGAADLARTRDFASIAGMFPVRDEKGEIERYEVISKSWTCSENKSIRMDREPFRTWLQSGKLNVIEGESIIYNEIADEIERWTDIYNVQQWSFDPHRALELMVDLEKRGISCYRFHQNATMYNEPCEAFQREVRLGRVIHGGDPVLTWQIGNMEYLQPKTRADGLVMPNKRNASSKIDAACATLMAFQGCLFAEKVTERGTMFLS